MTDISVIILVGREELHIGRCLEKLAPLEPRQVFIVESQHGDRTHEIAIEVAKQLQWQVEVDGGGFPPEVGGLNIELKRRFCGGEIRYGTVGILQARIFRYGCGRCEERAMDEHVHVSQGEIVRYDGVFYDDNLNTMDWWREKRHGYAKREARDALAFERGEISFNPKNEAYYRYPRYVRAFIYFSIRYFLKGGFLDGYAGWMWNFWQGLWYRCLVDCEIGKLRRNKAA